MSTPLQLAAITNAVKPPDQAAAARAIQSLMLRWKDDRVRFALESFRADPAGKPIVVDEAQARILSALDKHDRVAVRTGRGVGKTASAAVITQHFLATRHPALVVCSAGTWNHLQDKLWPEIHLWSSTWLLKDAFEYQTMGIFGRGTTHAERNAIRAVSASSDKAANVEGFHCPNFLLLIDEAKAMPDEIFGALLASLTSGGPGEEQKVIALSTPPLTPTGWFARVSTSTDWHTVHISGLDSPRVSRGYIAEIKEEFGENSPEYQSFVLGEIPEGGEGALIQARWLEAAQERGWQDKDYRPCVITCDVAREGDDLTMIGAFQRGKFGLAEFDDGHKGWFAHADLMETATRLTQAVRRYKASAVVIDATGLGGGPVDRLRQMQHEGTFPADCSIIPINFGSQPERPDRFNQRKDELWWQGREAIRKGEISLPTNEEIRDYRLPRGTDFKSQFLAPLYTYLENSDKVDVLDKRVGNREKTKGLPTKSPDIAHSFILGVRYYLRQNMIAPPLPPPSGTEEALGRKMQDIVSTELRRKGGSATNPYGRRG